MVILKDDSYDVFFGNVAFKNLVLVVTVHIFLFCVDFIIPMVLAF